MFIRSLLLALLLSMSSLSQAQTPKDQTAALSDLSQMFYEDSATFGREHLDRRKLDFSPMSLKHVNEYLEAIRKTKDVEKTWNRTVLRVGAYVGEVIRRNDAKVKWRWIDFEGARMVNPKSFDSFGKSIATAAVLYDGNDGFAFPLAKVEKYLNNGAEDDVYFFAEVIMAHKR
jgi:hypothetical protein